MTLPVKKTTFTFNHSDQVDELGLQIGVASTIQEMFDSRGAELLVYLNGIRDALVAITGAAQIGATNDNLTATTVQGQIDEVLGQIQDVILGQIPDGSITAAKLAANSVSAVKVVDGVISAIKLATDAVTAIKIANGAVTETKLGTGAVTSTKLGAGAVLEAGLGTGAVTVNKLGAGSVVEAKLGDGAVTANKIGTGAVTEVKLGANAVTAAKLATAVTTDINSRVTRAGDTMTGALVAQTNTNYTVRQMRNVIISTASPLVGDGQNGDLWIKRAT